MSWGLKKKFQGLLAQEQGAVRKDWGGKIAFALVYPNTYAVGMSNLGFQTIYRHLNALPDVVCERVFLPDPEDIEELRRTEGVPRRLRRSRPAPRHARSDRGRLRAFALRGELYARRHRGRGPGAGRGAGDRDEAPPAQRRRLQDRRWCEDAERRVRAHGAPGSRQGVRPWLPVLPGRPGLPAGEGPERGRPPRDRGAHGRERREARG